MVARCQVCSEVILAGGISRISYQHGVARSVYYMYDPMSSNIRLDHLSKHPVVLESILTLFAQPRMLEMLQWGIVNAVLFI